MGARDAWNKEEEVLVSAHNNLGNKWADIAKFIPG
jgi:myb proto-oncogene protein